MPFELRVTDSFEGAHNLRGDFGKCEALHGHRWQVEVSVRADQLDDQGIVCDFRVLKKALGEIMNRLDHGYLNEISPFDSINPSAENLARFIYDELAKMSGKNYSLASVSVWESPTSQAIYWP
ncbi:MAG: 6-carboxytetrahydropterin synthase QueD [Chloroflexi bacterium]|nr:6-carboxytetrahydropterin synthase QueD [Chloroflexota bacterium]